MSSQGSVIARVYTSDAYLPLQGVPVIFTRTDEIGIGTLLAIRLTDRSGLTPPILLDTPDASDSLIPGSALRPYSTVDIRVSHPGYSSLDALGVQVFPGVETVQELRLQPISPPNREDRITYSEPAQDL